MEVPRVYTSVAGTASLLCRSLRHLLSHLNDSLQALKQVHRLVRSQAVLVQ